MMRWTLILFYALLVSLSGLFLPRTAEGMPNHASIKANTPLGQEEILTRLKVAISAELPKELSLELSSLYVDGQVDARSLPRLFISGTPMGIVRFEFPSISQPEKPTMGNVMVRGFGKIAVTTAPIKHNEIIDSARIRFERHEITPLVQKGYYLERTQPPGLRANGYIRVNAALNSANTKLPNAIERLQMVQLIHHQGNLSISASLKALESGKMNDWIRLQNPQTSKIIQARVTGPGTASTR